MRLLYIYLLTIVFISLSACIKDEPDNPEADIETFTVDKKLIVSDVFIDQSNRKIVLYLTEDAYKSGVAPVVTVSKGAKVIPASGDSIHFDQPVKYTVISQSGENRKVYEVMVVHSIENWVFNFEKWEQHNSNKYEYPVEDDGTNLWSTGNPGVALAGVPKEPLAYPTRSTNDGYMGTKAAELVTLKGTALSQIAGVRLFPGSLFLGNFNSQNAMTKPLEATEFGQPFEGKALRFTGYYKYTPGADYQDRDGNIITGMTDSCTIYAVLFKGTERLNGTNILTSDRVVARAELKDGSAKSAFTYFDIPFEYVQNADLSGSLMLAVVASSSKNGDVYSGAIGSRLVVDSIQIIRQ